MVTVFELGLTLTAPLDNLAFQWHNIFGGGH